MMSPPKKSPLDEPGFARRGSAAEGQRGVVDSIAALLRRAPKGPAAVGVTPHSVVWTENKWKLMRFGNGRGKYKTPVLLVPSLINRWYVLDLGPGRSLIEWLVAQGHEVFCIDWGTPGDEDRYLTFDDVCDRYLGRAIRQVARRGPVARRRP